MPELESLIEEFMAFWWRVHPTAATIAGVHLHDAALEAYDPDSITERRGRLEGYLELFDRAAPPGQTREVEVEVIRALIRCELYRLTELRPYRTDPTYYLRRLLLSIYLTATREYAPAVERAHALTERLLALPSYLEVARSNLERIGDLPRAKAIALARGGSTLVREYLPPQLGAGLSGTPTEFARWENVLQSAESALIEFAAWLEVQSTSPDYQPAIGRTTYEDWLALETVTPTSIDDLIAYTEKRRAELVSALDEVAAQIGEENGWLEIVRRHIDEGEANTRSADVVRAEVARARGFVERGGLFEVPGGAELETTVLPEFLRGLSSELVYLGPAPFETTQRGLLLTPTTTERACTTPELASLVPALSYPGAHLQRLYSNRAPTPPLQAFHFSFFSEAWSLYTTRVLYEVGYFGEPVEALFALRELLLQILSVIAEIGIHTQGWSIDDATGYLMREGGLSRERARARVGRMIYEPAAFSRSAVGERELLRIRGRWRERGGPSRSLSEFHREILSWGTTPPSLIARVMGLSRQA